MNWIVVNEEDVRKQFVPNGESILKVIDESLSNFFNNVENIEPYINICGIIGEGISEYLPTLSINDISNENSMINFYIVGNCRGFYRLCFIDFQKC